MRVDSLSPWLAASLAEEGYKKNTIRNKTSGLVPFIAYLKRSGVKTASGITQEMVDGYAAEERVRISKRTGRSYAANTITGRLSAVRALMTGLYEAEAINVLILPGRLIGSHASPLVTLLCEADVATVLEAIDTDTKAGLRDRALFELIYGSGLRASEASRLLWDDVDPASRKALIRQSKFDKDRVVPLTHETVEMLRRYRERASVVRPFVFPGHGRKGLAVGHINRRFKELCRRVGLYRTGVTTHQLRHACATHLIAHGANLRYVQELLGHESIQTTVRYTRDESDAVQKLYRRYHPRENQLFEEAGERYRARLDALAERIRKGRKKTLARKARQALQ